MAKMSNSGSESSSSESDSEGEARKATIQRNKRNKRKRRKQKKKEQKELERRIRELDDSLDMQDFGEGESDQREPSSDYLEVGDPPQEQVTFEEQCDSTNNGLILTMR